MNEKTKRSPKQPHKKGANRHDPAIKHDKLGGKRSRSKDIREDRGIRKKKLAKPK
jgi:hypothetical protein